MMGIYKFQNNINKKVYIGQSIRLEARYRGHYNNYKNSNLKDYQTKFYRALRKYGFDNFSYEIIEQSDFFTKDELNEKEQYWIAYYDSYHNGYNSNCGGDRVTEFAEQHPMSKLTNEQVLEIKNLLKNNLNLSQYDIAKKYNITQSIISRINNGQNWTTIGVFEYPIRKNGATRVGAMHCKAALNEDQVIQIRQRYVNESSSSIYEDYKQYCSYTTFERVLLGKTYTNLPIYKKKQKKWINI